MGARSKRRLVGVLRGDHAAIWWAYRREDWPGTWLWRVFNAPMCYRRLSPTCDLGPIGPDMGWGEGLYVHLELPLSQQLHVCVEPVALSPQDWWL